MEIEVTEQEEEVKSEMSLGMPQLPPQLAQDGQMAAMLQMMMQHSMKSQVIKESFTNIENEFYSAFVEGGIITSDFEFTKKFLED
mmetsp:Transcript_11267/g.12724  ORF Transcript_11267/g.12724 Transcript_11267/m.12724 type:complete len:85 (+) Transcript_11267:298-552(+)